MRHFGGFSCATSFNSATASGKSSTPSTTAPFVAAPFERAPSATPSSSTSESPWESVKGVFGSFVPLIAFYVIVGLILLIGFLNRTHQELAAPSVPFSLQSSETVPDPHVWRNLDDEFRGYSTEEKSI